MAISGTALIPRSLSRAFRLPVGMCEGARRHCGSWLACALLALFAVLNIHARNPWDPDEIRYGQVAKEMQASGDWLVPRLWGELYIEKPPTFFLLVLLAARGLGGVGLSALVAPSMVSGCFGACLVQRIARRLYGAEAGVLAPILLATLPMYVFCTSHGRMDMLFAVLISLAVWWFYRGYVEAVHWARLASFAVMGAAVALKGPLAILLPVGIGVTFLAVTSRLKRLVVWETILALVLFVAVLACWLVPAMVVLGPEYLEQLVRRHIVSATLTGNDHPESMFYYLLFLPLLLLPWMILVVPAVLDLWRSRSAVEREHDLLLVCWLVVPLVILSLAKQKQYVYLLPILPPFAILAARCWVVLRRSPGRSRFGWRLALFSVALFAVLGVAIVTCGWLIESDEISRAMIRTGTLARFLTEPDLLLSAGGVIAGAGLLGAIGVALSRQIASCITLAALASVPISLLLVFNVVIVPALDARQSWRAVADALQSHDRPDEAIVTFHTDPHVSYYLNRPVIGCSNSAKLSAALRQHGSVLCASRWDRQRELTECGDFQFEYDGQLPSPRGPIVIVRVKRRPVEVAGIEETRH